jgi:RES domain-containing protein
MYVFRIGRETFIRDLTGEGARLYGGRWNRRGISMLYTSEYRSLAALEVLVHTPLQQLPKDLMLLTLSVPDNLRMKTVQMNELPKYWRNYPAPDSLVDFGSEWAELNQSVLLRVPSVVIPWEWNVLINPRHEEMKKIEIVELQPFSFDGRLIQSNK